MLNALQRAIEHPVVGTFIIGMLGTIVVATALWLFGYDRAAMLASLLGQLVFVVYAVTMVLLDIRRRG
jgi:predicted PurR-regulated permease PerM